MQESKLINLPYIGCCSKLPDDLVIRDAILTQIESYLNNSDVIFLEGGEEVGKTTLLLDFIYQKKSSAISYFVNRNHKYTYSPESLMHNLYCQIYFFCYGKEYIDEDTPDIVMLNAIQGELLKMLRNLNYSKDKSTYFIFDGFEHINKSTLELLLPVFDTLPWSKAKFVFSGNKTNFSRIFDSKKLKSNTLLIPNFGLTETKKLL